MYVNVWVIILTMMLLKLLMNIDLFKKLCENLQQTQWCETVKIKPKLRTYALFKTEFNTEGYLKCKNKYTRSLMSQLRCGVLPLEIERGRYHGTKVSERLCKFCTDQVEDEFHFICKCKLYSDYRNVMYSKAEQENNEFLQLSENDKFIYLMKSCKYTINYVKLAYNRRKSNTYVNA